jgi:hypothetical protein
LAFKIYAPTVPGGLPNPALSDTSLITQNFAESSELLALDFFY